MPRREARLCAALLLLAGCGQQKPSRQAEVPRAVGPAMCRVGPDGGPLVSDRGIGGTGGPSAPSQVAERGIGGTGQPAGLALEAERGIGGTGIIGVVTGFASVCLAGEEVAIDPDVPVQVDGEPAAAAALRAGQLAAIDAQGEGPFLRARSIAVRHEVSGPVEAAEPRRLRVAGQTVLISDQTWGAAGLRPGDWVAVSGVRDEQEAIHATRLDRREPGQVLVHGVVRQGDGQRQIGRLGLGPAPSLVAGRNVTVVGAYDRGVLTPASAGPDLLAEDPVSYFGPTTRSFRIEAFVTRRDGSVRLGRVGPVVSAPAGSSAHGVLMLERRPDGSLNAHTPVQAGGGVRAPVPSRNFEAAPIPNHRFDRSGYGPASRGGYVGRGRGRSVGVPDGGPFGSDGGGSEGGGNSANGLNRPGGPPPGRH